MGKWMNLALKIANRSDHQFKVGCVVYKGGSIISSAHNLDRQYRCSETRALQKWFDKDRYKGANMLIVRHNKGCSKPCPRCMRLIVEAGIDTIFYFDWHQQIIKEKILRA